MIVFRTVQIMRRLILLCLIPAVIADNSPNSRNVTIDISQNKHDLLIVQSNNTVSKDYFIYLNFVNIPVNFSPCLQLNADSLHKTITVTQMVGEPLTFVDPSDGMRVYTLGPEVTVQIHMQRENTSHLFAAVAKWDAYSIEPKSNYSVTLSPASPSWVPAPQQMGFDGYQEALVVSYPPSDTLCIQLPVLPNATHDVLDSPVLVFDGPSIYSLYVGVVEELVNCSGKLTSGQVTVVTARRTPAWFSPSFTLKSALDSHHLLPYQSRARIVVEDIVAAAAPQPCTFAVPQEHTTIDLQSITIDNNTTLQVWCGGLMGSDTSALIAEVTSLTKLKDSTLKTGCSAVTLVTTGSIVYVRVKWNRVGIERYLPPGSSGVLVSENWPHRDPPLSPGYYREMNLRYTKDDLHYNMLLNLNYTSLSVMNRNEVFVYNTNMRKEKTYKDATTSLHLEGYKVSVSLQAVSPRFRLDYQVTGETKACAALSLSAICVVLVLLNLF